MKLSTVFELDEKINVIQTELERLRGLMTANTSRLDGLPRPKSFSSRTESLAIKITDCERELAALVEESACAQIDLSLEIFERVKGNAGEVIYQRYIQRKTFKEISAAMNYSVARIFQLHRDGVKKFGGDAPRR